MSKTCAMCDKPATVECHHHLGNFGCGAPLCDEHKDAHHPDDTAWKAWEATDQGREFAAAVGSAKLWYAFKAGWYSCAQHFRKRES